MSDLIDDPSPGENAPEFSVSEISGAIKRVVEGEFGRVRVKGEVGRVTFARSGHVYYDLKDDRATLSAVTWKGQAARLTVRPEEGIEVVATGRLTTFPGQSRYQMIVDDVRPAGVGALMAMLEKRKKMLAAEGLFAPEHKKPLPYLPPVIGVITSPTGAVIRDILHRLSDRFPRHVLVWPVAVQGDGCAPQVTAAIKGFNALPSHGGPVPRPDLLIVARGGGAIEDLWGFNEESVARAAAASDIPLISAVGHETDTTLIDYVSDQRAPTPTAAAELAVPVRRDLLAWSQEAGARLTNATSGRLTRAAQRLSDLARALPHASRLLAPARNRFDAVDAGLPRGLRAAISGKALRLEQIGNLRPAHLTGRIQFEHQSLRDRAARLRPALRQSWVRKQQRLETLALRPAGLQRDIRSHAQTLADLTRRLKIATRDQIADGRLKLAGIERLRLSLGYEETLRRGYAVVRGDGAVVTGTASARAARTLEIQFADGRIKLGSGAPARKPGKSTDPDDQGSLF